MASKYRNLWRSLADERLNNQSDLYLQETPPDRVRPIVLGVRKAKCEERAPYYKNISSVTEFTHTYDPDTAVLTLKLIEKRSKPLTKELLGKTL